MHPFINFPSFEDPDLPPMPVTPHEITPCAHCGAIPNWIFEVEGEELCHSCALEEPAVRGAVRLADKLRELAQTGGFELDHALLESALTELKIDKSLTLKS